MRVRVTDDAIQFECPVSAKSGHSANYNQPTSSAKQIAAVTIQIADINQRYIENLNNAIPGMVSFNRCNFSLSVSNKETPIPTINPANTPIESIKSVTVVY